ncbi:MAG: fibronectin type III domain-containing protein [Clostridia bacterium]|nr:fibronectin type III domain-containing protein [Clostridia bacterium]
MKRFLALVLALSLLLTAFAQLVSDFAAGKPAAPAAVSAWATSKTQIHVSWSQVSGAKAYQVYIAKKANGQYKKLAVVKKNSYESKKLKENTAYYYKIKAVNGKQVSAASKAAGAKTHKSYSVKKLNKAYSQVVNAYFGKFGKPTEKTYFEEFDYAYHHIQYFLQGVNVVRLPDLNNDGVPELLISYTNRLKGSSYSHDGGLYYVYNIGETNSKDSGFFTCIYSFQGGKAVRIYLHKADVNGSCEPFERRILFRKIKGTTYMIERSGSNGYAAVVYKAFKGGKMQAVAKYYCDYNTMKFYRNKQQISFKTYQSYAQDSNFSSIALHGGRSTTNALRSAMQKNVQRISQY